MRVAPIVFCCAAVAAPALAATCTSRAGAPMPTVVELYTSEGCNSCPPADRWLSSLKGRADVLPIAFHVDYWDRLGWKDRFASAAYTERQYRMQQASGARFVYTPQILANGRDWRGWPSLPAAQRSSVDIELTRDGARAGALVTPRDGAPALLAGYWVGVEDGHSSDVRAGENAGTTLHHDAVARNYRELPPWPSREARRVEFDIGHAGDGARDAARSVALVIVDAATLRPVAALRCGSTP